VHAVIQTPTFLADGKAAGLDDGELEDIAALIGRDPKAGEVIVGTGGARKVRLRGKGKGKSGGFRVITFYAADESLCSCWRSSRKANAPISAKPSATNFAESLERSLTSIAKEAVRS
jgi:hypothetical protein